jgi:hypothetical protein
MADVSDCLTDRKAPLLFLLRFPASLGAEELNRGLRERISAYAKQRVRSLPTAHYSAVRDPPVGYRMSRR